MTPIRAVVSQGRLDLEVPADWPDGTQVEIQPVEGTISDDTLSPKEIARTLATMDQLEQLELTESELTAWETERQARKVWDKAHFAEEAEKLRRMWE